MKKALIKSVCGSDKVPYNPIIADIAEILGWIAIAVGIIFAIVEGVDIYSPTIEDIFLYAIIPAIPYVGAGFGCIVIAQVLYYLDGIYSRLYEFELEEKEEKK